MLSIIRHPLQELCVPSFVPNDTYLAGGRGSLTPSRSTTDRSGHSLDVTSSTGEPTEPSRPSMMVMTGPNFSGKSVYLKQVAVIVYMAHIGCFVPANRAVIGLTDSILTRVSARETVTRIQSAFMVDLQQAALALTMTTRRSLVIIDEFGKGTDSYDGAGLACGMLRHLLELGSERPKVMVATHFHEIFEMGHLTVQPNLEFAHMEVTVAQDAKQAEDQVVYLYNVRSGRNHSSYGNFCATKNGIDSRVIARAEELEKMSAHGEDLVAACASIARSEEEELKTAEEVARTFLAEDLREFFTPVTGDYQAGKPYTGLNSIK